MRPPPPECNKKTGDAGVLLKLRMRGYSCTMEFAKNETLINNFCLVQIRSTDGVVNIPALEDLYHTPSKIQYSISSGRTANGNLHRKSLRLTYPGLSETDFSKFDELIRGVYQVFAKTQDDKVYELSDSKFPMSCSTRFNIRSGHELIFNVSAPLNIKFIGTDTDGSLTGKGGAGPQFDYDFDFNLA